MARSALDNFFDRKAMDCIEQALEFFTRLVLNTKSFNVHWDNGLTGRRIRVIYLRIFNKLKQIDQASNLKARMWLLEMV